MLATMKDKILVGSDELVLRATGPGILAAGREADLGGGPPALHRHAPEEVYRVERGTLAVYTDDGGGRVRREAGPGDVVHIPGGQPHTVRNESAGDVAAYVVFSPGAPMERFFRAAAALEPGDDVLALAGRHGVEFVEPL
jgi:mannose-6-phosphate isomerase-like protein (cupin superfamily)